MKPSNDREAITLILEGLVAKGHTITGVIDDTWDKDNISFVTSVESATELMMGVDEAFVLLNLPGSETVGTPSDAYIYFVLGNSPEEVASDYTVNLDPDLSSITDPWW